MAIEPTRIDISATARGTFHLNDCRPNCAAGHYKTHSARITLFKVRHCQGQRRYLDIKVQPKNLPLATWGSDCRGAQVTSPSRRGARLPST